MHTYHCLIQPYGCKVLINDYYYYYCFYATPPDAPETDVRLPVADGAVDVPVDERRSSTGHRDGEEPIGVEVTLAGRAQSAAVHDEPPGVALRAFSDDVDRVRRHPSAREQASWQRRGQMIGCPVDVVCILQKKTCVQQLPLIKKVAFFDIKNNTIIVKT